MKAIDAGDVVGILGLLMVGAGLAAWDWRVALVVVGAILVVLAVVGAVRAGGK